MSGRAAVCAGPGLAEVAWLQARLLRETPADKTGRGGRQPREPCTVETGREAEGRF